MRDDSITFKLANEASEKSPRFIVEIEFEVESLYLTSHPGIDGVPGVVIENVLVDHSALSQRIVPDEARSEIGALSFELVDLESVFTEAVRSRLQDGAGLRGKKVRLFIGYSTVSSPGDGYGDGPFGSGGFGLSSDYDSPDSLFEDYQLFQTQVIQSVEYQDGTYNVRCQDITREQRKEIYEPKRTTLRASITATDTTIPVYVTDGFTPIVHGASYSDAPSSTVGYIKVGDEIIRYTAKTPDSFTGCTRGVLNTRAVAHDVDSGTAADRRPKVEEVIYLEMPAPKLAYAVLTGDVYGQATNLPSHWHLGVSSDLVKLSDFTGIGTDLWDTSLDAEGVIVRFVMPGKVDGKKFLESEIYPLIGCYQPVYSDGRIGLKRMNHVLADAAGVLELNESNCVSWSALDHDMDGFFNTVRIDWNWTGEDYTRTTVFSDADSISIHGSTPIKQLKFKGLHGSRHTDAIIRQRIDALRDRYTHPPQRMTVDVLPSLNRLEVGDIVRVKLPTVRDFVGDGDYIDRAFEIQRKTESQIRGAVTLDLFGSTGRAGVNDPNGGTTGNALPDGYYTATGTNLTTVCTIVVVGGVGVIQPGTYNLTGNADMNASGAVYYYNGDLQLASGATLTVNNNTQIRVKGFFEIDGTIDGVGRGKAGQADSGGWLATTPGIPGFLGNSRGMDGALVALQSRVPGFFKTQPAAFTAGQYSAFPFVNLTVSGASLLGIPSDMRGTSGGAGGKLGFSTNAYKSGSVAVMGLTGANGGAGLSIICRGLAFGASGLINLSGASSAAPAGPPTRMQTFDVFPGTGGAGAPGGLLILLDGSSISLPDIGGKFIGACGHVPIAGTPMPKRGPEPPGKLILEGWQEPGVGYLDEALISDLDMSNAAHRIQYIPGEQAAEEDDDRPPTPSQITVTGGVGVNAIRVGVSNLDGIVVQYYASADNDRTNALLIGEGQITEFKHELPNGSIRYYWARTRRRLPDGRSEYSDFLPSSSTGGISGGTFGATDVYEQVRDGPFTYVASPVTTYNPLVINFTPTVSGSINATATFDMLTASTMTGAIAQLHITGGGPTDVTEGVFDTNYRRITLQASYTMTAGLFVQIQVQMVHPTVDITVKNLRLFVEAYNANV